MSKLNVLLLVAGLAGGAVFTSACNSGGSADSEESTDEPAAPTWEAVCAHLGEIMEIDITEEMCSEMQLEVSEECGDNTNAAMRCVLDAHNMADFENCQEICE